MLTFCRVAARFRWVPRTQIQHADDLSKLIDRHDYGLSPTWRRRVLAELAPQTHALVDRFAAPHDAVFARFNALHDSPQAEAVDAFAQDWGAACNYLLPPFTILDRVLDKIERDNAEAVLVIPV